MSDMQAHYPLAPEQRGLWYLQQLAPECGAYHLLFSAAVDTGAAGWPGALDTLLGELMAAHPVLRTALPATPDGPRQRVHPLATPDLRVTDAAGWDDASLRSRMRSDSRAPFDLATPPLWRVHLYRQGPGRTVAMLVAHHVLLDFWSLGLLLQEVAARIGMRIAPRPALDGSGYGDYAARRARHMSDGATLARWRAYWPAQLAGAPALHGLPLDGARARRQHDDGRTLSFAFDRATSEMVRACARTHDVTPFMLFLAAYSVLLQRFSGDEDLVLATPVAGRTERSQRYQLGQFVNTVALRVRLDPQRSFADLLAQVRTTVVGALRHQDCPFAWLVEELAPPRDPGHAPIAQLGFSWERLPLLADFEAFFLADPSPIELAAGDLRLHPFPVPQQEGQLELALEMGGERDGAFVAAFKYQHALFDEATVAEMARCLATLTANLVAAPTLALCDAALADPAACQRWLALGIGRPLGRAAGPNHILHDIAAQVRATPQAPAVIDAGASLDYQSLWQRAGSIGAALCAAGVGPGARVGLMLERHTDLLAGMLGIWRAGAAYVPLDPGFPAERLAYIAEDAELGALLTEHALQTLWPSGLPTVCVDDALPRAAQLATAPGAGAGETAYILYTSGSTGLPKGVRVGCDAVHNFLHAMATLLRWDERTRLAAVTTPGFDISVLELLLPLVVGGVVCIADSATLRDGQRLAALLARQDINAMQATPASWKMLIDAGWQGRPDLTVLCGGEPLTPRLASELHARAGALWNVYGPTETTVWSSAVRLHPGEAIHIGRPIANTQLYVLDAQERLAPPGVLGELWIGGAGVALEYWRRPELSAERFRQLASLPHAGRLYRTGDRVRWTHDGRLEHHGRLDFQVKLRGFRIELGEIEALLRRQGGVNDAVVLVRSERADDPRLVAYLAHSGQAESIDIAAVKDALRASLPAYMLPSAFVLLDALPQTPNRKIDRKALPAPDYQQQDSSFIAPRDSLEIQLAGLFGELLELPRVSVMDSFFDLGGHSLLAVRLVAALKRLFGIDLPVAELVQHASVAALAARLREGDTPASSMLLTLRAGRDVQPLWLFHPIGGTVFCYLELTRHLDPARPVLAIQSPGLDQAGEADVTIEAIAMRYLALVRERQPHGPYLLGGWCFGGAIAFEMARQLQDAGATVDGVILIDTRAPIPANVPSDADDATLLSWFARDLAAPYAKTLTLDPATLRALPGEAMFGHVLDAAKAIDVLAPDADHAQLARYFEVYMGNAIALQLYFPPPQQLPTLLLRAADEAEDYGPSLGWSELTPSSLELAHLPGTHNSIMYAPQAAAVAAAINARFPHQTLPGFST